jgi:CDP-diacylglycerol--serine O-phosphatidyltransferase
MESPRNVLLPNLVTVGNGVCGFWALVHLFRAELVGPGPLDFKDPQVFAVAAWVILLGMVFDVFDGKVARMSGGASAMGAQLDSLCDLLTFGLAPAVMMLRLCMGYDSRWQRIVWVFALAYFLCAMFRLARFTAENEPDDSAHEAFKGLPSPAAAGCVASLVIFYAYVNAFEKRELLWLSYLIQAETLKSWVSCIPTLLPFFGLFLGFAMVSGRLRFEHMGSWFFGRKHGFESYRYIIFGGVLIFLIPEIVIPLLFLGYLVYAPSRLVYRRLAAARSRGVPHE